MAVCRVAASRLDGQYVVDQFFVMRVSATGLYGEFACR
jgi:hypothetical protein